MVVWVLILQNTFCQLKKRSLDTAKGSAEKFILSALLEKRALNMVLSNTTCQQEKVWAAPRSLSREMDCFILSDSMPILLRLGHQSKEEV